MAAAIAAFVRPTTGDELLVNQPAHVARHPLTRQPAESGEVAAGAVGDLAGAAVLR